jgi:hypothetical protein
MFNEAKRSGARSVFRLSVDLSVGWYIAEKRQRKEEKD